MRYKIQKQSRAFGDSIRDYYYVLYEKKVFWKREPIWKYCREHTYASYSSLNGERVYRNTVDESEKYIKIRMIEDDGFEPEDIKIYECRDSKLEKILK